MKDKLRELAERWRALADKDTMADDLLIGQSLSRDACAAELLKILDAEGDGGAVAEVGRDWTLLWVGHGPIAPIINQHNIRIGDKLYTHPQPVRSGVVSDEWVGEIECCDAKGFWLILADDCPFVPGQKVTITATKGASHER